MTMGRKKGDWTKARKNFHKCMKDIGCSDSNIKSATIPNKCNC